jgi:hypothetical protein
MRFAVIMLLVLCYVLAFPGCTASSNSDGDLDSALHLATRLGKAIFEYDQACQVATDTLRSLNPDASKLGMYLAMRDTAGWRVAFGQLSDSRQQFFLAYEIFLDPSAKISRIREFQRPKATVGFYRDAALCVTLAREQFTPLTSSYNYVVLPVNRDSVLVYFIPAQVSPNIYPLGGDAKFLVSATQAKVISTTILHRGILSIPASSDSAKIAMSYHNAVVTTCPVETDVFFVLHRQPPAPHRVFTMDFDFLISTKGDITYSDIATSLRGVR